MSSAVKYECPQKKQALFVCNQKTCTNIALKCISTDQCKACSANHNKCPRQMKIGKVMQLISQRIKRSPILSNKVNDQNLIQQLINQLQATKKKYLQLQVKKWGLDANISSLLYEKQIKGKNSNVFSDLVSDNIIYANIRYLRPPQFRKDVDQVKQINTQLQKRMLIIHKCYKNLAEIDCELQNYQAAQKRIIPKQFVQKIELLKLYQLSNKLKQAIKQRLELSNVFADQHQQILRQQQQDFQKIAQRIFNLLYLKVVYFYNNRKNNQQILKLIDYIFSLFAEQRKQLRLKQSVELNKKLIKLKAVRGFTLYNQQRYQQAFQYFNSLQQHQFTVQILTMLIQMHEFVMYRYVRLVQFLLLYLQLIRLQTQQKLSKLDKNDQKGRNLAKIQLLMKQRKAIIRLIQCYSVLNQLQNKYKYSKILNEKSRIVIKLLNIDQFKDYLQSEQYCLKWQQKRRMQGEAFRTMGQILKTINIYFSDKKTDNDVVKFQFFIRQKIILLHRYVNSNYQQSSKNAVLAVNKYLTQAQKNIRNMDTKYLRMLKTYSSKFLTFHAEVETNTSTKIQLLKKAVKLQEQLKVVFFKPHYMLAKLSYQLKSSQALQQQTDTILMYQNNAILIYPTDICYRNRAYLIYEKYIRQKRPQFLQQCIKAIDRSLALLPNQIDLYSFRGIVYQNMKRFRNSNKDFEKALPYATGEKKFDMEIRMAQNYQHILKQEEDKLKTNPQQKNKYIKIAEQLYKKGLQISQNNTKCLFGYGRILKLQQKYEQAQQKFMKVLPIFLQQNTVQLIQQAYMQLGDVKLQQAIANDDRDFQMLEQALELYQKAGNSKKNLKNIINVYKQLGDQGKAQKLQQQLNKMP